MNARDSRELFNAVLAGKSVPRPPIWIMRQAGRYLPEYRALKGKYGFKGIVKNPEAALEAALQPVRRFDFDCAIVFSDILAVSEALGFPYEFGSGGIFLERRVEKTADVERAEAAAKDAAGRLSYVFASAGMLRRELPRKAVFGFCGAPFTTAAYMVEGAATPGFPRFREFFTDHEPLYRRLADAIERALIPYCEKLAECGVDAVQVFDSHAALAPEGKYAELSGKGVARIFEKLKGKTARFLFAGETARRFGELLETGADAYSLGSGVPLPETAEKFFKRGIFCLQGNMDPRILEEATPAEAARRATEIVREMRPYGRHIFNLGRGITPGAKPGNVDAVCDAVKNYSDERRRT